ncbi:Hypothetical_protein [Hexamita inflata]|uniref:Hypothetical_protein n=1 Tax=Hexamita inflata TaxID=28002 RepID=A0AA86N4Q5_9EUKA|nr:Hypothetical protein HINF_LOCUS460 [Hexamita inflata]
MPFRSSMSDQFSDNISAACKQKDSHDYESEDDSAFYQSSSEEQDYKNLRILRMQIIGNISQLNQIKMITSYLENVTVNTQLGLKRIRQTQINQLDQIIED